MRRTLGLGALLLASTALMTGQAQAGAFSLREQSAIGLGMGFAGAAAGSAGLSSMFWNPATMTNYEGMQSEWNLSAILPYASITPTGGTSPLLLGAGYPGETGDISIDAVLPASYSTYQLNDKIWLGLAMTTPYGLSTKNPYGGSGSIYARTSVVASYDVNPTIAYKVNDWLSVAAGFRAMYFKVRLNQSLTPGPGPGAQLKGNDWSYGFTAGITLKPIEGTEIGIGYRSHMSNNLDGHVTFAAQIPGVQPLPASSYGIKAKVDLPDEVTIGVRQMVTPDLTVSAGFEWTNWSRLGTIPVIGKSGLVGGRVVTDLPFEYDDGYFTSIGAEYQWNPDLVLRAGLGYEWSPISDKNRDLRLPDSDRIHTSIGLGYKYSDSLSFDVSYSYIFSRGGDVKIDENNVHYPEGSTVPLQYFGDVDARVHIIGVAMRYRWDTPPAPAVYKP